MSTQDPFGTRFYRGNNADPIVYTKTTAEVTGYTFPELTRDAIERTHFESANAFKEFFAAKLRDAGEFGLKIQVSDHTDLAEFYTDMSVTEPVNYKVKWPDNGIADSGADFAFAAVLTKIGAPTVEMGNRIEVEMTFKLSGMPAFFE